MCKLEKKNSIALKSCDIHDSKVKSAGMDLGNVFFLLATVTLSSHTN